MTSKSTKSQAVNNQFIRHHPNDGPEVEILEPVENCTRKTQTSDYIRYYGSGATMDGKVFWENSPDYTWDTYLGYGKLIPGMEKVRNLESIIKISLKATSLRGAIG